MSGQPPQPQRYDDDPTFMMGAQPAPPPVAAPDNNAGTARRAVIAGLGIVCAGTLGYVAASRLQSEPAAPAAAPPAGQPAGQGGAAKQPALVAVADVPAGGGTVIADAKVVVTKDQAGQVRAFTAICTHQGCTVESVSGGTINCPCHGSKFDATTGRPVAGPAPSPLSPVAVAVRDGAVVRT